VKLLVGLGNPGPQYETTRHNAGFLMADLLAEKLGISWGARKFDGEFAKGSLWGEPLALLKPLTFMNLSGRAVAKAMQFFKIAVGDLIVLHDDIDVPAGAVRARAGGGHGGHNGIRSIMAEIGGEFHRIKLGLGRPPVEADRPGSQVSQWVLGPMSDEELASLQGEMLEAVMLRLKNIFPA